MDESSSHKYPLRSIKQNRIEQYMTTNLEKNQQSNSSDCDIDTRQHKGTMMAQNSTDNAGDDVSNAELKTILIRMETTMNERLAELTERVEKLSTTVDNNVSKIAELEDVSGDHDANIKDLIESATSTSEDLRKVKEIAVPAIRYSVKELREDINKQLLEREIHDRKYNLLFYGVPQEDGENVHDKIRDVFETDFNMPRKQAQEIFFSNVHRLPRRNRTDGPDPLIVRFGAMGARNYVLDLQSSRGFVQGRKPVVAYTDLPAVMKRERGKLVVEARKLRREGKITRIRVVDTKVIMEHKEKGQRQAAWTKYTG